MATESLAPWARPVPARSGRMTPRDLAVLPDDAPGYELVDGRLVRSMPTGGRHGRIGMKAGIVLGTFVEAHALGCVLAAETGFDLSTSGQPNTVLAPGAAFVRADHLPARDSAEDQEFWRLAPDLVIEVASPSQYQPEMAAKALRWLAAGVRLLWVIWPAARQVAVWRRGATEPMATLGMDDMLDGLDVVPGFRFPVARLFN